MPDAVIELPRNTIEEDGKWVITTRYYRTLDEARAAAHEYRELYAVGYGGSVTISPPNADRPYAVVVGRRFHSCD